MSVYGSETVQLSTSGLAAHSDLAPIPRGHSSPCRPPSVRLFFQTEDLHCDWYMKNDVVPVQIRGIIPANSGCAIFIGNEDKVFVIQVEHNMGAIIGMFLRDTPKERPLTHDLVNNIFKGFNISVERAIITELKNSTYFARLILKQQNELGTKLVELDARPSDCLAIATAQKRPVFVTNSLFDQVEDMSKWLEEINENGGEIE
jgi:bifunctional DNase/RNase